MSYHSFAEGNRKTRKRHLIIRKIGVYYHSIGGRALPCSMIGMIRKRKVPKKRTVTGHTAHPMIVAHLTKRGSTNH